MKDDNEKKQGGSSDIDPKMLTRIQSLRLMDDDFMTVVFSSDKKLTELLLKILLSRDDLRVKSGNSNGNQIFHCRKSFA